MALLRALRTLMAAGAKHVPGTETEVFHDTEDNAVSLESRGLVERVHEEKMQPPVEDKMAEPVENKSQPITTESLKPEPPKRKPARKRAVKKPATKRKYTRRKKT